MKKLHSVAFRFLIFFILGIVIYSGVLFSVIRIQLEKGLELYIADTLVSDEHGVEISIENIEDNTAFVATWVAQTIEENLEGSKIDPVFARKICVNAADSFGIGKAAVYDIYGRNISEVDIGNLDYSSILQNALMGRIESSLVTTSSDLYAVTAQPIEYNNTVVGAAVTSTAISSQFFVEDISNMYNVHATYFSGYNRSYTTVPGMKGVKIDDTSLIDTAMSGSRVVKNGEIGGTPYLVNYFPIKDKSGMTKSVFFIGKELSAINIITNSIFKPVIILATVLTVIFMGIILLGIYGLVIKKLNYVGKSMANLSSGDADLTKRIPATGKDEFADLCNNVNIFMALLQGIIQKLNSAQDSLENIGQNLGANSQESASATTEIMANIDSVRRQAKTQSNAVEETSKVLDGASAGVDELMSQIDNQVAGITESSAAIEEMLGNISSVSNSVKKMADSFQILDTNVSDSNTKIGRVGDKVNQMADQSQMLLQANNMISQVASQTNLLAMNAAIEAAHAGEAGKGFSVVADEIRKLAETTTAQSKNINVELKEIISSIQEVVGLSKDARDAFESIVTQLGSTDTIMQQIDNAMAEQSLASNQILEALADMKNQSAIVTDKSQELKAGVDDVNQNMITVAQVSDTILGSMDEMAAGSQQISSSSQNVSDLAMQTQENIELMDSLLKQFKV